MEENAGEAFGSVSAIGHSLGGYSALRLAGAQPALDGSVDVHCAVTDDEMLCNDRMQARFEAVVSNGEDFSDARIDRIVLLAPAYGPLFGSDAVAVDAKVLVVAAKDDAELSGHQVEHLINGLGAGTDSSAVDGGHFVFLRPCTDAEATDVPAICEDPDGVDRSAIHAELGVQIGTFVQA